MCLCGPTWWQTSSHWRCSSWRRSCRTVMSSALTTPSKESLSRNKEVRSSVQPSTLLSSSCIHDNEKLSRKKEARQAVPTFECKDRSEPVERDLFPYDEHSQSWLKQENHRACLLKLSCSSCIPRNTKKMQNNKVTMNIRGRRGAKCYDSTLVFL